MAFGKRLIQDLDQAYSDRISDLYLPADQSEASALRNLLGVLGATAGGGVPSFRGGQRGIDSHTADGLLRAYSLLPKYGAPVAGVTAAGMALQDLTDRFTAQTADDPKETTVQMPY